MTKGKKLLLILILILLALVVWRYISLKRNQPESGRQIGYREFFGLGNQQTPGGAGPTYQPDFIDGGTSTGGEPVSPTSPSGQKTPESAFKDSPALSPLGSLSIGEPNTPGSTSVGKTSSTPRNPNSTSTGLLDFETDTDSEETLLCDPRDIALEFTPEEKERLRQLELQLLQMAPELRSAENVEDEVSTYESFAIYGQKIAEYKNFCFEKTARFPVKPKRRPTPFWNDPAQETEGFYSSNKAFQFGKENDQTAKSYYYIEHLFEMNIW